ncbi:MAG: hypothetical protein JXD22_10185 [Sedimentisphaerales bacterium]|nr:hypothetical protein [Sedimentisphaerales bacterium]
MFKFRMIVIVLVSVCVCSTSAWAKYGGGHGTEAQPYLIAEPNDILEMSNDPNNWDKHFKLMADINLARAEPNVFTIALIAPDTDNTNKSFKGTPFPA